MQPQKLKQIIHDALHFHSHHHQQHQQQHQNHNFIDPVDAEENGWSTENPLFRGGRSYQQRLTEEDETKSIE